MALDEAMVNARKAVELAIGLVGIMCLWLGLMRLAEVSGLVQRVAWVLRPVLVFLFPDVPPNHPAMGSMVLNLAANALGLTNAATPLGLRAMRDLQSLNPHPGVASNAMCTFLALNTGSVQLIPVSAVAVLVAAGAKNPTWIIGATLITTTISSLAGLVTVKVLARIRLFRVVPEAMAPGPGADEGKPADDEANVDPRRTVPATAEWPALLGTAGLVLLFGWFAWGLALAGPQAGAATGGPGWVRWVNALSLIAVPFLLVFFPLYAGLRKVPVYEQFIEGAKEGFQTSIRIIPYLVGMLVAIGFFRGAGGIDLLARVCEVPCRWLGFPTELLPMALLRPLTGSGTLAAFSDVVTRHGPDSLLARTAGTLFGSTETTFYVISVYFGAVGIRRTRHAVWAGLAADAAGALAAVHVCRWLLGAMGG